MTHTHTVAYETEYALFVVRNASGRKVGQAATESTAKSVRRHAEKADRKIKEAWLTEQREADQEARDW